jgi:hypothetical protein
MRRVARSCRLLHRIAWATFEAYKQESHLNPSIFLNRARAAILFSLIASACGGGGSAPTAPSPPPAAPRPLSTAIVLVLNASTTVEPTATGVLYRNTFTLTESSHRSGATIASIRVNLSNATRNGNATFDRNDNIPTALASGASNVYVLNVSSDNRDPFTQVTFVVTYADDAGVGGSFTSPTSTSITPVPAAANTPPVLTPGAPSGKFDGVYNFFISYPTSSTTSGSQNIARFMTIRNGVVSAADGLMAGTVDNFGLITFTWPCIITPNSLADFRGSMNALSSPNFGEGTYICRIPHDGPRSWQANQSR